MISAQLPYLESANPNTDIAFYMNSKFRLIGLNLYTWTGFTPPWWTIFALPLTPS